MRLEKLFLGVLLAATILSPSVLAAAACELSISPRLLAPATEDFSQNPGRVSVSGFAEYGQFDDTTSVEVDCNVGNAEPAPKEKYVKPYHVTFSASTFKFLAYCTYRLTEESAKYEVQAFLKGPTPLTCTGSANSAVIVQVEGGAYRTSATPTPAPTASPATPRPVSPTTKVDATPYAPGGSCGGSGQAPCMVEKCSGVILPECKKVGQCNDGSTPSQNGVCPGKPDYKANPIGNPPEQEPVKPIKDTKHAPPALPSFGDVFTVKYSAGWNLVGPPYGEYDEVSDDCDGLLEWYVLAENRRSYIPADPSAPQSYAGKGIWAYAEKECEQTFVGLFVQKQKVELKKGWNIVSVQTQAFDKKDNLKSSCVISKLLEYDAPSGKYFGARGKTLRPGFGYMVNVKAGCIISAGTEEDDYSAPPAPPSRTTSTTGSAIAGTTAVNKLLDNILKVLEGGAGR